VTALDPGALGRSLAIATRDFCVPYVVDGASVTSFTERPGVTEMHYSIHGQEVTRYRLEELPGTPEVSFRTDECQIRIQEVPVSAISALVAAFRTDLRLDRYTTSEVHLVPGPHTLVVGEPARPGALPRNYSTCVHGEGHALVQMSVGIVDVTSDPGSLAIADCIPHE
jgi:hypothetical protein